MSGKTMEIVQLNKDKKGGSFSFMLNGEKLEEFFLCVGW